MELATHAGKLVNRLRAQKCDLKQKRCRRLAVFRLGISSGSLLTRLKL